MSGRSPRWIEKPVGFAGWSWAQIIAACQSKQIPPEWKVHDWKNMTINGAEYRIDIIGMNHDDYADGSGKAPLTLQLHDCYAAGQYGITGGSAWIESKMRTETLPAILALMPAEVQSGIREVTKLTKHGSSIDTTADKLFLPSVVEVYEGGSYAYTAEGQQYAYYSVQSLRRKKTAGKSRDWWTRTRTGGSNVATISDLGSVASDGITTTSGIDTAFCFCF